jgi:hypothetical protein
VLDVIESKGKQTRYVIIVQTVKDLPACFSRAYKMHLPESAQLMGDGGFSHFESIRQRADAHLTFDQDGDNPYTASVTESAEQFGKLDGFEFGKFHNI